MTKKIIRNLIITETPRINPSVSTSGRADGAEA